MPGRGNLATMKFQTRHVIACVSCIVVAALAACGRGNHPGGTVGDECFDVGSSDECFPDEICDEVQNRFNGPYCLFRCGKDKDCAEFEECNGVSGDNGKACHPK